MRASVEANWLLYNTSLEGRVYRMYRDVFGYITTAVGINVHKADVCARLPWKLDATGELAPKDVVRADWAALKARSDMIGKRHDLQASITRVHLTDADVDALVMSRLRGNYVWLKNHHFSELDSYCADAQMGILSVAWAYGSGFPGLEEFIERRFEELAEAGDWLALVTPDAAGEYPAQISEHKNAGVIERNKRNRVCFHNASIVDAYGLDPERLWWPSTPTSESIAPTPLPLPEVELPPVLTPRNDVPSWIGPPVLGLSEELYDELSNQRRKENLEDE